MGDALELRSGAVMLRAFLVVGPRDDQVEAVAEALARTPLTTIYTARSMLPAAEAIGERHALQPRPDDRLTSARSAIALIEEAAAETEGSVVVLAPESAVRGVVEHALAAPVVHERWALEAGAFAEIEVRLDAPWTVNRLNDACHLEPQGTPEGT